MGEELTTKPRIGFVQFTKYNREDGTFEGVMASSAPDQSQEIMDWASSKPHFQRWFNTFHRNTGGKSLGNVREMHQPIAAGKLTYIKFDDDNERIHVHGRVFNPETKVKLENAVLTGLSIGGDYGKRWADPKRPGFMRYEAKPYEVSLVDNPCNPDAQLTLVGGDTEKMVKFAAAAVEFEAVADDPGEDEGLQKVGPQGRHRTAGDFAVTPDPMKPSTWRYPVYDAEHVRESLTLFKQDRSLREDARRTAWAKILRAADRLGVDIADRSYKTQGAPTMSPDEIVAQELRKQEAVKAAKHEALGRVRKAIKRLRKTIKTEGVAGGLQKTYVDTVGGYLNDLGDQIRSLQSAFTPAVAAGMPLSPGKNQPGENIGGGSGEMVTSTPSSSGDGAMVPGAGKRAFKDGKSLKKMVKKLAKAVEAIGGNQSTLEERMVKTLAAVLRPPTDQEVADAEKKAVQASVGDIKPTGGAPVRLVKDANDAAKVGGDLAKGAADEMSDAEIAVLQQKAADTSNPEGAAKARVALEKISEGAVRKALTSTAQVPVGQAGFRTHRA